MAVVGSSVALSPAIADYPVLAGQMWRYLAASVVLVGLMTARRDRRPRPDVGDVVRLVLLAASGLAGFNWCIVEGAKRSDPAFIAAVVGASPVALAILGPVISHTAIRRRTVVGGIAVATGIVVVQSATAAPSEAVPYAAGALVCEVAFTLLAVPLLRVMSPIAVSAGACVAAVPLLLVLAVAQPGPDFVLPSVSQAAVLLYLAVMTTAVAFVLWYGGVIRLGADRAGLFTGVMPVAALAIGVVVGTSSWSPGALAGSLLCGGGIAVGLRAARAGRGVDGRGRLLRRRPFHVAWMARQRCGGVLQEAEELDRERQDDGGVLLRGDFDDGLEQAQLQG
jgi:drug/metabolite transporter (DMT)-like permease